MHVMYSDVPLDEELWGNEFPLPGWWWASYGFCAVLHMLPLGCVNLSCGWIHHVRMRFFFKKSWSTGTWMKWCRVLGPDRCTQKYVCNFACNKRKKKGLSSEPCLIKKSLILIIVLSFQVLPDNWAYMWWQFPFESEIPCM